MSQQLTDRSRHGRCLRNARANPAWPDVAAADYGGVPSLVPASEYADAFAVAVAHEVAGCMVTGDPEFERVEDLVPVRWMRSSTG